MNSSLRNENNNFRGLNLPPLPNYLNNNSFNTSNSLAVSEQETLNERLFTTEEILGLKNVIPNGLSSLPEWAKEKFETLADIGEIKGSQNKYPNLELGLIKQGGLSLPPLNNLSNFGENDIQNFKNILDQILANRKIM